MRSYNLRNVSLSYAEVARELSTHGKNFTGCLHFLLPHLPWKSDFLLVSFNSAVMVFQTKPITLLLGDRFFSL